jgi:trk system potassium uptake protein TrkH
MRDHWQVLGVIAPLIVIGGLGMPVLSDLWRFARQWIARLARASQPSPQQRKGADPRPQLSLHSRVVLSTTLLAVLAGAAGLLVLETQRRQVTGQVIGRHAIGGEAQITADWQVMDRPSRLGAAVFQSVSARSGGFSTIDCAELGDGGKLWLCGIMSIGGSPAGTAGGMRTTTLALLVFAMFAAFARRDEVRGFQQPVAMTLVIRAVGMAMAYFCFVLAVTLALSVTLRDIPMVDLLFTASSACGNVGLSTGIASHLDDASKFIITAAMYIGRVGPLMVLMYMAARPAGQRPGDADVILA